VESILKPIRSMTIFLNIQVPQDAENQTQGCTAKKTEMAAVPKPWLNGIVA